MRVTKKTKDEMIRVLSEVYVNAKPALVFRNPFELLVAVILSAQCTDQRVNIVTKRLFAKAATADAIVKMGLSRLEEEIHECGFYHAKAKNILATSEILARDYDGKVPEDFDALIALPGVGRKTANVVMSVAFNYPAIAVDTHVFRVANRLRLATGETPEEVEFGLQKAIPREQWSDAHHWLIWHGRKICKSRRPLCADCPLAKLCPSFGTDGTKEKKANGGKKA
ncbi:MAG: endonuclease III [Schwartzia sp.]|nr:endonuclease III [Schwartzia sp. (in: firmicutes)]MBO6236784.1 endonuclease III [Schwartzia sp. (in: firmicutes)]MBP3689890.1 endonuclease III [Schwartzia sp. (in: firmicutes)]